MTNRMLHLKHVDACTWAAPLLAMQHVFEIAQPLHQRQPGWISRAIAVHQRNMDVSNVMWAHLNECRRMLRGSRHIVTKGLPAPNITVRNLELRNKKDN